VDTWWQTETGAIMIAPIPGAVPTKPGSATRPFFGIQPEVAFAMVQLGLTLEDVPTALDLEEGLAHLQQKFASGTNAPG
jgi:hypothetical protein